MQWIVLERPGSGKVATNFYNDVGTVYETPGRTGVSQLVGWFMRDAARTAGWKDVRTRINHDHQCLLNVVPSTQLAEWLKFESRRLREQTFPDNIDAAKQAQLAEVGKRTAKGAWLLEELQRVAFLSHPYGQSRWGFREDVEQLTSADAADFYRTWFVPANLIAVVSGDVRANEVRELAEKLFGPIPGGRKAPPLRAIEPRQRTERRILAAAEGDAAVAMAFHKGAVKEDSYPVWDVLAPATGARLKKALVDEGGLATRVSVHFLPAMKYRGLLAILTFLTPGADPAKVEKVIDTELERLARAALGPDEFSSAVKAWAGSGQMTDEGYAQELGDWQAMTGDYRHMFRHRSRVEQTTPAQVQALAAETFRRDGRTVAIAANGTGTTSVLK